MGLSRALEVPHALLCFLWLLCPLRDLGVPLEKANVPQRREAGTACPRVCVKKHNGGIMASRLYPLVSRAQCLWGTTLDPEGLH